MKSTNKNNFSVVTHRAARNSDGLEGRMPVPSAVIEQDDPSTHVEPPTIRDWRVRRVLAFLDSEDGRTGQYMAGICRKLDLGISADYAVKLFKKETGIGFREYAAKRRLMKAATQLIETSLSIKVIAAELGYNSPQDFSRRFKFQFQVKPTEFRRRRHT
jgi:AraC-like DNA-binding protein